ncbi:MAG TPA: TonB-dependent receptor [Polyangiaceae bacterium]|nr:TonB-dependent receptor [Polyangiaceae bacterium]
MRARLALLLGVTAVVTVRSALAQDTRDVDVLLEQSVVSTASRASEVSTSAPATTLVITADDLKAHGIQSLDQAINYLSTGMTVASIQGGGGELSARGVQFTGDYNDHVLLLIDGHAVNDPWSGTSYFGRATGVPFELIDHIEVMLGPSSVVYGSNAMLGVVNVITKHAKDFTGLRLVGEVGTTAPQGATGRVRRLSSWPDDAGSTYRAAFGYGREFSLGSERGEVTLGGEYTHSILPAHEYAIQVYGADSVTGEPKNFGPRTQPGIWGGKPAAPLPTDIPAAYARVSFGEFELLARGVAWKRSYVLGSNDFGDPGTFDRERWFSLELRHRAALGPGTALRTRLYGDSYVYRQVLNSSAAENCEENQLSGCRYDYRGGAHWLGFEPQLSHDWTGDGTQQSMLGVSAQIQRVGATADYVDNASGVAVSDVGEYHQNERSFAAYLQHTAAPLPGLWLNGGARLDSGERGGTAISPRAAVTVSPWNNGAVKLIYAEAFRSPTAYETYYEDPYTISSQLTPEKVRGYELSLEQRLGANRLLFSAFYSRWLGMIGRRTITSEEFEKAVAEGKIRPDVSDVNTVDNGGTTRSFGYSALLDGTLHGKLRYGLSVTAAYARQETASMGKSELPAAPSFFGNARVSYALGGKLPTLALATHWMGRRLSTADPDSGFEGPRYSTGLLALRATISGLVPQVPRLSYRIGGSYLLSKEPSPYLIGPTLYASELEPRAHYDQADRLEMFAGLEWRALD